ncbi:MAG: hypothetical protein WEB00_13440 [Dehalococcoidia bacterium]
MSLRWLALGVAALVSAGAGYAYYELSQDQFGFEYQEEDFLSLAWAAIVGVLCFAALYGLARLLLPDES